MVKYELNDKCFALISVLISTFLMSLVVVSFFSFEKEILAVMNSTKVFNTKRKIFNIAALIILNAKDVDADNYKEPLKERSGNLVPLSIPFQPVDEWGTELMYCAWDLGNANNVDSNYSQNNTPPPKGNLMFRIISAGKDKVFQTNCSSVNLQGDDFWYEWFERQQV